MMIVDHFDGFWTGHRGLSGRTASAASQAPTVQAAKEPVDPDTPLPLPPENPPDLPLEIPQELPDTDAPGYDLPDPMTV